MTQFLLPKDPVFSLRFLTAQSQYKSFLGFEKTSQRYTFFWARNAIFHSLRALNISHGAYVLVPSYICSSAVEPIVAHGAKITFYKVQCDCQPDFADLESKVSTQTQAVLVVHYFGFPQQIKKFREFCDHYRLALIEDCAHVLQGDMEGQPIGSFGDASVFSWRKFLPLYDGAELVLNRTPRHLQVDWYKESILFTLKVAKNLLDTASSQLQHPILKVLAGWMQRAKGLWDSLGEGVGDQPNILQINSNSVFFDESMVNLPISRLSRWVLAHSNIPAIIDKRRWNYLYLRHALSSLPGTTILYPDLPLGVCPWIFPLYFDGMQNAHLALRQRGIPAVTWQGVRHPHISKEMFPDADFLYQNLVFLPVHQCLHEQDLDTIVKMVKVVRQKGY